MIVESVIVSTITGMFVWFTLAVQRDARERARMQAKELLELHRLTDALSARIYMLEDELRQQKGSRTMMVYREPGA